MRRVSAAGTGKLANSSAPSTGMTGMRLLLDLSGRGVADDEVAQPVDGSGAAIGERHRGRRRLDDRRALQLVPGGQVAVVVDVRPLPAASGVEVDPSPEPDWRSPCRPADAAQAGPDEE